MKGHNLKFTNLKVEDRANYTCRAQNSEGYLDFTYVVDVNGNTFVHIMFLIILSH